MQARVTRVETDQEEESHREAKAHVAEVAQPQQWQLFVATWREELPIGGKGRLPVLNAREDGRYEAVREGDDLKEHGAEGHNCARRAREGA